ncbi:hypothetical protein N9H63_01220 [bacterium]|nr:hypothetical protein [bacterium]
MRGYSMISDEERASILNTHRSFYDGYATGNVPSNQTPLTVEDLAQDKKGLQVTNTGEVKEYDNNLHEQAVIDAPDMDVSDVEPAYDFVSDGPEDGEMVMGEEDMVEKEMCEQCGSEMVEGECMECGMYEEIDEDLHESFKTQRETILENFNRFKKFN